MQGPKDYITWNSSWTFCLAVAGLTVGLQLVWTLPAQLDRFGTGSGFVLVYLLALLVFAGPIMAGEIWLGRESRRNPMHAVKLLQVKTGISRWWRLLGPLSLLVSLLVLSYLCVFGGWAMAFGLAAQSEVFLQRDADYVVQHLDTFLKTTDVMVSWQSTFLLLATGVSAFGVIRGVGFALRLLMPLAVLLLVVLLAHNVSVGALTVDTLASLLQRDYHFSWDGAWSAIALAFFTASAGMGGIMACAAHMPEHQKIAPAVAGILLITLVCAALSSAAVLPLLWHSNVEVAAGAPLVFLNLPLAYGFTVYGDYYGSLFFLLVAIILLSSAIILLEPLVAWLSHSFIVPRYVAAFAAGGIVWLLSMVSALSFNEWSQLQLLQQFSPFRLLELLTAYGLIPLAVILNGFLVAALLNSPRYKRYSGFRLRRLLARAHLGYAAPLLIAATVWFAVQNRLLY